MVAAFLAMRLGGQAGRLSYDARCIVGGHTLFVNPPCNARAVRFYRFEAQHRIIFYKPMLICFQ
jgi:hypothetical protein